MQGKFSSFLESITISKCLDPVGVIGSEYEVLTEWRRTENPTTETDGFQVKSFFLMISTVSYEFYMYPWIYFITGPKDVGWTSISGDYSCAEILRGEICT